MKVETRPGEILFRISSIRDLRQAKGIALKIRNFVKPPVLGRRMKIRPEEFLSKRDEALERMKVAGFGQFAADAGTVASYMDPPIDERTYERLEAKLAAQKSEGLLP